MEQTSASGRKLIEWPFLADFVEKVGHGFNGRKVRVRD
jgi:hypothetical protein